MIQCLLVLMVLLAGLSARVDARGQEDAGAIFLSSHGVLRLNLNSGEQERIDLHAQPLPYRHEALSEGGHLLSFVDHELVPGFVVVDSTLAPRIVVRGAAASAFGDGFLLGVGTTETPEGVCGRNQVTLWSLADYRRVFRLDRTILLTPLSLDYRASAEVQGENEGLLLLRYMPSLEPDPNYPWQRELTFLMLSPATGTFVWKQKLDPGFPLAGIDLLWQDGDFLLLAGRVDINHYYYACLDASSGTLRWQKRSRQFPVMRPDYPYLTYASVFAASRDGDELRLGTIDPERPYLAAARLNLRTGEIQIHVDSSDIKAMELAYLSLYPEPRAQCTSIHTLAGVGILTIVPCEQISLAGPDFQWEIPYLPCFGSSLEAAVWGRKYLVLVERPERRLALGYQGKAYLLEMESGKLAHMPMSGLVFFEPWSPAPGRQVLLTVEELAELSPSGVRRWSLRLQES